MTEQREAIEHYHGWELSVERPAYWFRAEREGEDTLSANSLSGLKERVDARNAEIEKMMRTTWPKFECMNSEGVNVVTRGLHKKQGKLLATPGIEGHYVYPRAEWIRELLKETEALKEREREIYKELASVRLSTSVTYSGYDVARMAEDYEKFGQALAKAQAEANNRLAKLALEQIEREKQSA